MTNALHRQKSLRRDIWRPLTWQAVQEAALMLFALGQQKASQAGLILVDTKYEFGSYRGRDKLDR
jgi:phosphoribosylaminoimidazole-succinocarboxamide synthase